MNLHKSKNLKTMEIPERYTDLVGKEMIFEGAFLSYGREERKTTCKILNVRWGSAKIFDRKTMKDKHPTVEFLIKNSKMKRSQWTKPFPVTEIIL